MTRHFPRRCLATLLFGLLLAAPPVPADEGGTARVNYVTSATIYVDAGTADGLHKGDIVVIRRDGVEVAALPVERAPFPICKSTRAPRRRRSRLQPGGAFSFSSENPLPAALARADDDVVVESEPDALGCTLQGLGHDVVVTRRGRIA